MDESKWKNEYIDTVYFEWNLNKLGILIPEWVFQRNGVFEVWRRGARRVLKVAMGGKSSCLLCVLLIRANPCCYLFVATRYHSEIYKFENYEWTFWSQKSNDNWIIMFSILRSLEQKIEPRFSHICILLVNQFVRSGANTQEQRHLRTREAARLYSHLLFHKPLSHFSGKLVNMAFSASTLSLLSPVAHPLACLVHRPLRSLCCFCPNKCLSD